MVSLTDQQNLSAPLLKLLTAVLLFFIALSAKNDYTRGDARLNLLTSQSLIERGRFHLDHYLPERVQEDAVEAKWSFYYSDGHCFNFYPPGAAIFSVPFVAIANKMGHNMILPQADKEAQRFLAALLFSLMFLVLVSIAEKYLSGFHAWGFSLLFCLGTAISSSLAQAIWSQTYYVLFCLLSLLILVTIEKSGRIKYAWLIAFPVFAAFLCRPVAVIPGFIILLWMRKHGWPTTLKYLGVISILLGLFCLWSYREFNQLLPVSLYFENAASR